MSVESTRQLPRSLAANRAGVFLNCVNQTHQKHSVLPDSRAKARLGGQPWCHRVNGSLLENQGQTLSLSNQVLLSSHSQLFKVFPTQTVSRLNRAIRKGNDTYVPLFWNREAHPTNIRNQRGTRQFAPFWYNSLFWFLVQRPHASQLPLTQIIFYKCKLRIIFPNKSTQIEIPSSPFLRERHRLVLKDYLCVKQMDRGKSAFLFPCPFLLYITRAKRDVFHFKNVVNQTKQKPILLVFTIV